MLIQVLHHHSRGEPVYVLGKSPHMPSIGVGCKSALFVPRLRSRKGEDDIPYMPVGATTSSIPKAAFPVPASNLNDSLSPEVIGAGSKPADLWDTVMCFVEL